MKTTYKLLIVLLILFTIRISSKAQIKFQAQAGLGYIEHLSFGIGCEFSNKHSLSLLYGSNFFVRTKHFASYMGQYKINFNRLNFRNITPALGVKGGTNIFTDEYYRWNVLSIIPFVELHYPVRERFNVFAQGGCTFSFEQSVVRIKDGDIGSYKKILPEFKAGVLFNLTK